MQPISFYSIFVAQYNQPPKHYMRRLKIVLALACTAIWCESFGSALNSELTSPRTKINSVSDTSTDSSIAENIQRPALVVNIVIGGLPYDFMTRFGDNLTEGGFRRFATSGTTFTAGRYEYMPVNYASSLATITTGTTPSVHGVVGTEWYDVLTGRRVSLIEDPDGRNLDIEYGGVSFSNVNLSAPTLGDRLIRENPKSKVLSIAADPVSAIVMAGLSTEAMWINPISATWTSSVKYMNRLPDWVVAINRQTKHNDFFKHWFWTLQLPPETYSNTAYDVLALKSYGRFRRMKPVDTPTEHGRFAPIAATPLACDIVADFAMQAIINEHLGEDDAPDILNICFDAPRNIITRYGLSSVEAEDAFYHLDHTLASLMSFIDTHVSGGQVLFVLTSDHGFGNINANYDDPSEQFNGEQFRAIVNSFLCAHYGGEDWVAGYHNRRLYINRQLAFERDLQLDALQRTTADFALQFRGISRMVPSCDMRPGSLSDAHMQRLINGYYPKRSGDILVDLVPGRCEAIPGGRCSTGSAFDYDTHVPFMMFGCGVPVMTVDTDVDMASLPVTLARILGIQRPEAATAHPIDDIF